MFELFDSIMFEALTGRKFDVISDDVIHASHHQTVILGVAGEDNSVRLPNGVCKVPMNECSAPTRTKMTITKKYRPTIAIVN